jgi:hypothetical protein
LFPSGERHRLFAVLAAAEAFFFGRGDDLTVHDQRGGRIVEYGVDPEDAHRPASGVPVRTPGARARL